MSKDVKRITLDDTFWEANAAMARVLYPLFVAITNLESDDPNLAQVYKIYRGGHSGAVEQRRCFFSSGSGSAAVFFCLQRKGGSPLFLRWSSDQRNSASVKVIDLPLALQQKIFDFQNRVLCSNLIIKSQLKTKLKPLRLLKN